MGGKFYTKRQANIAFKFPELDATKTIHWDCHIDETTAKSATSYDMITRMDCM
jgi:hypothetical protein